MAGQSRPMTERDSAVGLDWIDEIADQFDAAWQQGPRPKIARFLGQTVGEQRGALIQELVKIDLEYRCRAGEKPNVGDYLSQFPELLEPDGSIPNALVLYVRKVSEGYAASEPPKETQTASWDAVDGGEAKLRCPHCGNTAPLADSEEREVSCPACGSSFRVERGRPPKFRCGDLPRVLGKFQLLDLVGEGSFGAVYKARDAELDRTVAVKLPRSGYFISAEDKQRFLREAKSAAQLVHPNIVQIHDIGREGDMPYIVSDFVAGQTLAQVHQSPLTTHQPMLMDFGLARRDEGSVAVTLDGKILGTPAYMAPEQALGDQAQIDGRTDIYGLGVILYEMLTGELPFRGSMRMILQQVLHDEPRPPRRLNDRIPRDLQTICLKAMAKSPARRYATAGDLAADLRRFLKGEPIQARPVGPVERLARWAKRNPGLASLAATVFGLLLIVAAGALILAFQQARLVGIESQARLTLEANLQQEHVLVEAFRGLIPMESGYTPGLLNLVESQKRLPEESTLKESLARMWSGWYAAYGSHQGKVFSHNAPLVNFAMSADGKVLATACKDRTARVWNWETGQPMGPSLPQWVGGDAPLSLSPDGKYLANQRVEADGIRVSEIATGKTVTIPGASGLFFSPQGRLAALSFPKHVEIWGIKEGELPTKPESALILPDSYRRKAFSPDEKLLVTGLRSDHRKLRVRDTATGLPRTDLEGHEQGILCLTWNKESTRIATGAMDHTVCLWDAATGIPVTPALKHPENVHAVAFNPNGKLLATGCYDGWARLWDTSTGAPLRKVRHDGAVYSVEFSADGQLLATGSMDGTARLWRVDTGEPYGWPTHHQGVVFDVRFHPDGKHLVTASSDGTARAWAIPDDVRKTLQHPKRVWCVDFSPDGKLLATGCEDGSARLWDTESGKEISKSAPVPGNGPGDVNGIWAVAFDPQGTVLAAGGANFLNVYLQPGLSLRQPPWRGDQNSRALAFHPRGDLIVGAGDGYIHFWEPSSGQVLGHVHNPQANIYCMAMSPDGRLVAVGTDAGYAQLWDTATRQPYGRPLQHESLVEALAFSPDGQLLATAARDMTLRFWNPTTGEALPQTFQQQSLVQAIAFHPTQKLLALGYTDGTVRLLDQTTGLPCGPAMRHGQFVTSVAFSKDGKLLASASFDKTAKVWHVPEIISDLHEMELRTWVALGARLNDSGTVEPIPWDKWQELRDELRAREAGGE